MLSCAEGRCIKKAMYKEDATLYPKLSSDPFTKWKNILVTNPINTTHKIYQYIKVLRLAEYHDRKSLLHTKKKSLVTIWHTLMTICYYWRLRHLSYKTGFQIPPHTCGKGLQIWHYGYIIINEETRIGENLTIYPGVEIGHKIPGGGAPQIGDNCFIGAGAKIFGKIRIGNNVTIAPNAVVMKDVPDNVVVGGIPAKIIRYKNDNPSN